MDSRQQAVLEQKVHETLYNNIFLLTAVYPTTKEFDLVFRKDKFANNNKTAFFEVVHYLLNVLNPEQTKEKLTCWPLHDVRQEPKFRSQLISYLNEINSTYQAADLPLIQASNIVCPSGFRIAKLMLKLSELVLYEHLVRSGEEILMPQKPIKGGSLALAKTQIDLIKKQALFTGNQAKNILSDFEDYSIESHGRAMKISSDLTCVSEDIKNAKLELERSQNEFNLKYSSCLSKEDSKEKLRVLKNQIDEVVKLKSLFSNCESLIETLRNSDLTLQHDESNFEIPNEVQHMISNRKELNLVEYFDLLKYLLEKKALKMSIPNSSFLSNMRAKLQILTSKYEIVLRNLVLHQSEFEKLMEELEAMF